MRDWRNDMIAALENRIAFLQGLIEKYRREMERENNPYGGNQKKK